MKSKEQKRAEAEARQSKHESLASIGKLAKASVRPGESKREKARLLAEVNG